MITRRGALGLGAVAAGAAFLPTVSACSGSGASSQSATPVPSPSQTGSVSDAQSAAELALWAAQRGMDGGSYGIGGALIHGATGRVLLTMPNRVFQTLAKAAAKVPGETFVQDPTAHGERQMMSWYLANREALQLPAPAELTVVTSLDPCLMCTGSILTAGVNAGVLALDPYSGVNYDDKGTFGDVPSSLRQQTLDSLGYYAASGGRAYQGSQRVAYWNGTVSQATLDACNNLYNQSANNVRAARSGDATPPSKLQDPGDGELAVAIKRAFRVTYEHAFAVKVTDGRRPSGEVRDALQALVSSSPGATNAVAFLDPFGNLVTAAADQELVNPLSTAFALCSRQYAQTRYGLVDDPENSALARATLTNPTYGTFVFLRAPDPNTSVGLFDIGAYGSTMGSQPSPYIPSAFQYYELPPGVSELQLQQAMVTLPPLYSAGIKIMPQRVVD